MKNLRTALMCLCTVIIGIAASAQNGDSPVNEPDNNKPKLFSNLPNKIILEKVVINDVLTKQPGQPADIKFSADNSIRFEGSVASSASKYNNTVNTIVLRSTNYPGATLSITRIAKEEGGFSYTGRLISLKNGDLFELKEIDGSLVLLKKNFYDLINE